MPPSGTTHALQSLWGRSASDVWAAGGRDGSAILHWDGTGWTRMP